jgi:hypothetical protein
VLTRPDDLTDDSLRAALLDNWDFCATSLTYQAVGFGSHHWLAADARGGLLFVTVDELTGKLRSPDDTTDAAFGRLERAFVAALSLRQDAGLGFVVAPVPGADGRVLSRLAPRHSVVVHPYLDGHMTGRDGEFACAGDRREVLELLIALHAAHAQPPRADDFAVPLVAELSEAMGDTAAWDSVLLAPPERDLWALTEADPSTPETYTAATGVVIDDDALALYRLWYDLAEIAEYVSLFRGSHGDTADTAEAWRNLRHFLRPAERWPDLAWRWAR